MTFNKLNFYFFTTLLLQVLVGYFVGCLISYVNLFGTSQNAPKICAMGAGLYGIYLYIKKKNEIQ